MNTCLFIHLHFYLFIYLFCSCKKVGKSYICDFESPIWHLIQLMEMELKKMCSNLSLFNFFFFVTFIFTINSSLFYYYSKGCSADEVLHSSTAGVYRNNGLTGILGPRWFWFGRRLCAFRSFIISREVKLTMKTMLHFQTAGHPQIDHWSCQVKDRRFSMWGINFIIKENDWNGIDINRKLNRQCI